MKHLNDMAVTRKEGELLVKVEHHLAHTEPETDSPSPGGQVETTSANLRASILSSLQSKIQKAKVSTFMGISCHCLQLVYLPAASTCRLKDLRHPFSLM